MLSLAIFIVLLFVSILFSIVITSFGEDNASRVFVWLFCMPYIMSFVSSSWCHTLPL